MNNLIYLTRKTIKLIFFICSHLPRKLQSALGVFLGIMWFDILRIRRQIIFANLDRAFPAKTRSEKTAIGRASCINLGLVFVEFMKLRFFSQKNLDEFVIYGLEHLEAAGKRQKGVCILTLHLGNGDYACAGFALIGRPVTLISKQFRTKWINDVWFEIRTRLGTELLLSKRSSYHILKALKKQKRVVFAMDQFMGSPSGVKTTFFGHPTGSSPGLAFMAERTGAPVLPMYTYRNKEGKTEIHCGEEIPFVEKGTNDATIAYMTQVYQDKLEEIVTKHPDQWMWVHRRWKPFVKNKKPGQGISPLGQGVGQGVSP